MRLPAIHGIIDRRVLVNYRVDPEVAARVLPAPFRPKLANGHAIAGVCLIRLKHIRPNFVPAALGIQSENAAHRYAVEWDDDDGQTREGVFIPRRDSDSRLNALVGGRLFPGVHHHAHFVVRETDQTVQISLQSDDGVVRVHLVGKVSDQLPASSTFGTIEQASSFFEAGSLGYSATSEASRFDGLELRCKSWHVQPLDVQEVRSSHFEDASRFPSGSVDFDCALLMRNIEHEWHTREDLCCSMNTAAT